MGFARLDVWVHDVQDPCRISDATWRINVTDCQNRIVSYCGRRYANIPARCGHVEFALPPGCYIVWGALGVAIAPPFLYANYITHFAFVHIDCHESGCVHLYAPTYKMCWRSILLATQLIARQKGFPNELARTVDELTALGERLAGHAEATAGDKEFDRQVAELGEVLTREPTADEELEG